jgi:hypothetical protein
MEAIAGRAQHTGPALIEHTGDRCTPGRRAGGERRVPAAALLQPQALALGLSRQLGERASRYWAGSSGHCRVDGRDPSRVSGRASSTEKSGAPDGCPDVQTRRGSCTMGGGGAPHAEQELKRNALPVRAQVEIQEKRLRKGRGSPGGCAITAGGPRRGWGWSAADRQLDEQGMGICGRGSSAAGRPARRRPAQSAQKGAAPPNAAGGPRLVIRRAAAPASRRHAVWKG